MVTQPAYIKVFKDYTRAAIGIDRPVHQAVNDLLDESDRGAVILVAARIEDTLEWAIMQKMQPLLNDAEAKSALFGAGGSNATFSAKINLAYALGVIDRDAKEQIGLIRVIRNGCAHSRLPIDFQRPEMQGICKTVAAGILDAMQPYTVQDMMPLMMAKLLRDAFVITCTLLEQYIVSGQRQSPASAFSEALNDPQEA